MRNDTKTGFFRKRREFKEVEIIPKELNKKWLGLNNEYFKKPMIRIKQWVNSRGSRITELEVSTHETMGHIITLRCDYPDWPGEFKITHYGDIYYNGKSVVKMKELK